VEEVVSDLMRTVNQSLARGLDFENPSRLRLNCHFHYPAEEMEAIEFETTRQSGHLKLKGVHLGAIAAVSFGKETQLPDPKI
jgi:hypothetical protein